MFFLFFVAKDLLEICTRIKE